MFYISVLIDFFFTSDGRYLDDSWVSAPTSKSSKPRKEKSRSPLRATTLESNVKKNNHVEFREPLVSYRLVWEKMLASGVILY